MRPSVSDRESQRRPAARAAAERPVAAVVRWRRAALYGLRLGAAALLTSLLCLFALLPPIMADRLLHPERIVGRATPADLGVPYEDFAFAGHEVTLSGWYVPGHGRAAVVLLHGFTGDRSEMLDLVPALHNAGFHLLLYDQRGTGLSEGDGISYGYYEAGDALAAATTLRGRSGAARVGVLGMSQGAATALVAAGRSDAFDAVVADSAYADLEAFAVVGAARLYGPLYATFSALLSPLILWHAERQSGLRAASVRPIEAIGRISPRPVLLIHGINDTLFGYENSEALYAAAGLPKDLWLVPGAVHAGARLREPAAYRARIIEFFGHHLGTAAAPPGS